MKTSIEAIAAEIVTLSQRFHSLGDVSIFSLLEATGYFGLRDQISAGNIHTALLRCPESTEEWMQYSEDKRTSSGWYLTKTMKVATKLAISQRVVTVSGELCMRSASMPAPLSSNTR